MTDFSLEMSLRVNVGFCAEHHTASVVFHWPYSFTSLFRPELDACDVPEKYPQLFQVTLDVEMQPHDKVIDLTPPWEHYCTKDVNPSILFSSHQEHQDTLALGGMSHLVVLFSAQSLCVIYHVDLFPVFHQHLMAFCLAGQAPIDIPPDNPRHFGQGGFFSSLCWQGTFKHFLSYMVRWFSYTVFL